MKKFYICYFFIITTLFFIFKYNKTQDIINNNHKKEEILNFSSFIEFEISKFIFKQNYKGNLYYANPNNICLYLSDKKEIIEVGSNNDYFWYSSSFENNILYYGNIKDVHNILKEIFNPLNIKEIIFPKIKQKNGLQEDELIGNYGKKITRQIFIENSFIKKQNILDENKKVICTVVYSNYINFFPTHFNINYINENCKIYIKLKNLEVNQNKSFNFDLPLNKYSLKDKLSP